MKSIIINMERSVERKKRAAHLFSKTGLQHEFYKAIDGRVLSPSEITKHLHTQVSLHRDGTGHFNVGALGCALSHYGVYQQVVNSEDEYVAIFEDDVMFGSELKQLFPQIENHMQVDDIVLLYFIPSNNTKIKLSEGTKLTGDYKLVDIVKPEWGVGAAGAYILHRSAAVKLYHEVYPIKRAADAWIHHSNATGLNLKCVYPFPVLPTYEISEIGYGKAGRLLKLKRFLDKKNIWPFSYVFKRNRERIWNNKLSKLELI